jgi:hypothetical protein
MVGTAVSRLLAENGYAVSRLLRRQSAAKIVELTPIEKPVEPQVESEAESAERDAFENEIENEIQSEAQAEPLTDIALEASSELQDEVRSEIQSEPQSQVQEETQDEVQREIQAEVPILNDVRWDPAANEFDAAAAEGADAVCIWRAQASAAAGGQMRAKRCCVRAEWKPRDTWLIRLVR